jgi:membrane-associated phospholipid phosphatase
MGRVFPSPALWIGLGAIAAADLVLMAAGGFRLVGWAGAAILAVSAAACALGYLYSAVRPDERLAALGFGGGYMVAYTLVAAVLSYLGTSLSLPLLDAGFARADAALGLDWLAALDLANAWPLLGRVLRAAYATSMPQVLLVFLVLASTRQLGRLADFLALFTATSLATIVTASLLPAAGAFVYFDPPAALRRVVGADAGIWHLAHFEALRSGAMRTIDPGTIEGLVTFPSFHAALAVITVWALWRTRWLALPALALNALVIVSTVPVGGHYYIDVVAGIAIAAAAVGALAWRRRTPMRRSWAHAPAASAG